MVQFNPEAAKSRVTAAWVADLWSRYPITAVLDSAGQPTGRFRTGIVRVSFPHLFTPQPPPSDNPNKAPTWALSLLFPFGADLSLLIADAQRAAGEKFGANAANMALHTPFRDQREKAHQYEGYVPGAIFFTASSQRRPPVVDVNGAPIVDETKAYAGCWAMVTVHAYPFDTPKKKGVSFGLDSVMIVADDDAFGAGGGDPNTDFAGVSIEQQVNPAALFAPAPAAAIVQPVAQPIAQPLAPPAASPPPPAPVPPVPVPARPTDPSHIHAAGTPGEMWWYDNAWHPAG